jgi:hypothetical protein
MKIRFLLFSILLVLTLKSHAQSSGGYHPAIKYPKEVLLEDFRILKDALKDAHPTLYWYNSEAKMDSILNAAYEKIDKDMTENQYYKIMSPLISEINCSHTTIEHSDDYEDYWEKKEKFFPFDVAIIDKRIFIKNNKSEDTLLLAGYEILSINGIPSIRIIKEFIRNTPMDGGNLEGKYKFSELRFARYLNTFYDQSDNYSLVAINNHGEIYKVKVRALKTNEMIWDKKPSMISSSKTRLRTEEIDFEKNLYFKILKSDPQTALLSIKHFAGFGYKNDFKDYFKALNDYKVKNLIIDLRDNPGGYSISALTLFRFLADERFKYYNGVQIKNRQFPYKKHLKNHFLFDVYSFFAVSKDRKNDTYKVSIRGVSRVRPIKKNNFDGRIYILTNGVTNSAASLFAANAQEQLNAMVIGEATGGGFKGCSGGYTPYFVLPNTKIKVRFPLMKFEAAVNQHSNSSAVQPVFEIRRKMIDVIEGRDSVLEFTLELILREKERYNREHNLRFSEGVEGNE